MVTRSELITQIAEVFPAEYTDMLAAAVVAAIGFEPVAGEGALGATRIGGMPDLSPGIEWPVRPAADADKAASIAGWLRDDRITDLFARPLPYSFLAQVDLAEAGALGEIAADLPGEGRLLFFYDYAAGPWSNGPEVAQVIWDRGATADLVRADLPQELHALAAGDEKAHDAMTVSLREEYGDSVDEPFTPSQWGPPRPMRLVAFWSLPGTHVFEISSDPALKAALSAEQNEDEESLYDLWTDFEPQGAPGESDFGFKPHKLLGLPDPEQDDPRFDAFFISETGRQFPEPEKATAFFDANQHRTAEWRLLLQIDIADYLQMRTEGTVYFLIRKDDLRTRNFDRVVAVYQQT